MYNLLKEDWLPVRLAGGETVWIAPFQIVRKDVVSLAPARADFKTALLEFFVGLMQTAFAPNTGDKWETFLEAPPTEEELSAAFAPHEPYFELLGERPLFLQDLTMSDAEKPVRSDIDSLLIEQANADLFVHPGQIRSLCPACAAAALYTLQTFAPSGGRGHRTSLRGGGPLSTLLGGTTLWESVWLNVLPCGSANDAMPAAPTGDALKGAVYPWAAPTRTSEKNQETHVDDVHPLHAYWGMPRRLLLETSPSAGICDICGRRHEIAVTGVLARPSGYNYGPYWQHPLTPYSKNKDGPPLSIKGQDNAAAYNNWLGIVYGEPGETSGVTPARCCRRWEAQQAAYQRRQGVNVAGYNMSNMKAVSWCEHVFPIIELSNDEYLRECFAQTVAEMVQAANQARRNLVGALKGALVHQAGKKQASLDKTLFANVAHTFWTTTEEYFYCHVEQLAVAQPETTAWRELRFSWGKCLYRVITALFEAQVWTEDSVPIERLEQRIKAQEELRAFTISGLRKMNMYPPKQKEKKS